MVGWMALARQWRQVWIAGVFALACGGSQAPARPGAVQAVQAVQAAQAASGVPSVEEAPIVAAGEVAVDREERFIVPEEQAAQFYGGEDAVVSGYFTPGEDEVRAFEFDLPGYLEKATDPRARGISARLSEYRRQFIGVTGPEGRWVFGNYLCGAAGKSATVPVTVKDGGDCYFNVLYEPGAEAFARLRINGEG